jgi:hypothetical protein
MVESAIDQQALFNLRSRMKTVKAEEPKVKRVSIFEGVRNREMGRRKQVREEDLRDDEEERDNQIDLTAA